MAEETTNQRPSQVYVSIADIKTALKNGVTRLINDPLYNPELGSIQEKYGLKTAEVKALFQDVRLRNLRVVVPSPSRIVILEDEPATVAESTPLLCEEVLETRSREISDVDSTTVGFDEPANLETTESQEMEVAHTPFDTSGISANADF